MRYTRISFGCGGGEYTVFLLLIATKSELSWSFVSHIVKRRVSWHYVIDTLDTYSIDT